VAGYSVDDDGCENQCNVQGMSYNEGKYIVECIHDSIYNRSNIHGVLVMGRNIRFSGVKVVVGWEFSCYTCNNFVFFWLFRGTFDIYGDFRYLALRF